MRAGCAEATMTRRPIVHPRTRTSVPSPRLRRARCAPRLFGPLLGLLLAACAKDEAEEGTGGVAWRCTQTPSLDLAAASCACTSFQPGDDASWVGAEVTLCDYTLVCCFIGPSPADTAGTALGIEECRCVKAASCEAEKAARPGVRDAGGMCPPAAT